MSSVEENVQPLEYYLDPQYSKNIIFHSRSCNVFCIYRDYDEESVSSRNTAIPYYVFTLPDCYVQSAQQTSTRKAIREYMLKKLKKNIYQSVSVPKQNKIGKKWEPVIEPEDFFIVILDPTMEKCLNSFTHVFQYVEKFVIPIAQEVFHKTSNVRRDYYFENHIFKSKPVVNNEIVPLLLDTLYQSMTDILQTLLSTRIQQQQQNEQSNAILLVENATFEQLRIDLLHMIQFNQLINLSSITPQINKAFLTFLHDYTQTHLQMKITDKEHLCDIAQNIWNQFKQQQHLYTLYEKIIGPLFTVNSPLMNETISLLTKEWKKIAMNERQLKKKAMLKERKVQRDIQRQQQQQENELKEKEKDKEKQRQLQLELEQEQRKQEQEQRKQEQKQHQDGMPCPCCKNIVYCTTRYTIIVCKSGSNQYAHVKCWKKYMRRQLSSPNTCANSECKSSGCMISYFDVVQLDSNLQRKIIHHHQC